MKNLERKCLRKCIFVFVLCITVIAAAGIIDKYLYSYTDAVSVIEDRRLIPGGQSVGIKMDVKGVLVVGIEEIETETAVVSPGLEGGVIIGDMILSINDIEVSSPSEVYNIVERVEASELPLELKTLRNDEVITLFVTPVRSVDDGKLKMGLWVKEKIAGIGTLTFYDPDANIYGALGHGIYESKTETLVDVKKGELLNAVVRSIEEGEVGNPGEIRGVFHDETNPLGKIITNSKYGVFATCISFNEIEMYEALPVASLDEIEKGSAHILTTIEGDEVKKFEIEIKKVNKHSGDGDKGLEIEVTDKELLNACGGIVQGMSGSPIIQDGKLVGAVTHVLVNDPTRGYGIFIENMLESAK